MKHIAIVGSGSAPVLAAIRKEYPDVEVITPEEAKKRGIETTDRQRIDDIPILNHSDIPILEDIPISRKADAQPWKRRGKNAKV